MISEARREAPGLLGSNQAKARYPSGIEGTTRMLFPALGLAQNRTEAMSFMEELSRRWEILLVEDNPADIRLTQEALKDLQLEHRLQVAEDGVAALAYLSGVFFGQSGTRPDIILLDLNLPRMGGLEVLAAIKSSDHMKSIPVIIMSSSASAADVTAAYRLNANCYTKKPMEIDRFFDVMQSIRSFWLETALLPDIPVERIH